MYAGGGGVFDDGSCIDAVSAKTHEMKKEEMEEKGGEGHLTV